MNSQVRKSPRLLNKRQLKFSSKEPLVLSDDEKDVLLRTPDNVEEDEYDRLGLPSV